MAIYFAMKPTYRHRKVSREHEFKVACFLVALLDPYEVFLYGSKPNNCKANIENTKYCFKSKVDHLVNHVTKEYIDL